MAGIITTIWPAIATPEKLVALYELWVRILRMNFTHYTPESVLPMLELIKQAEEIQWGKFDLYMDMEWPSIRTGVLATPREYKKWQQFKLHGNDYPLEKLDPTALTCDEGFSLFSDVKVGGIVRIESGSFDCKVIEKWEDYLLLEAGNDFVMTSRRHINLPNAHINLATITENDKKNLAFAMQMWFSYLGISFCRSADDVREARMLLEEAKQTLWVTHALPKIITKIENKEWVDNIEQIAEQTDVVMVARGDLWAELPIEDIPEVQMKIIKVCKIKNAQVVVATQMLKSMVEEPSPTRAEVSDVYWAARQWADYLMLSEETAMGKYPVETVSIMKKIIEEALDGVDY